MPDIKDLKSALEMTWRPSSGKLSIRIQEKVVYEYELPFEVPDQAQFLVRVPSEAEGWNTSSTELLITRA